MIDKSHAIIDDNNSIPFSSLSNIISKTANYYFTKGVKHNSNIAILGYNSIEYVIAIYSLWKIGAIPVPINTRLNKSEIINILHSSNCNTIILDNKVTSSFNKFKIIPLKIVSSGIEYKHISKPKPNDTAVIIHTSGSGGNPKGVEITNNNLYQSYIATAKTFNFSNNDKFLASLPFYHIGGFSIINRALLSGGTLVLPKTIKQADIITSMAKENPTVVSLVPTMLKRIIKDGVKPNIDLRHLFLGGGPSDANLINTSLNNNWPIVKVYGSSETTAMVTGSWGKPLKENPAAAGKPFTDVEIIILDETKSVVPYGVVGEVAIKSLTIAKGYLNNSKLWNEKNKDGFYLTGDFGYLDKKNVLYVVSRRTDLIVSGGENIDPREIENILNQHRDILESLVIPLKNIEWGQIPVAVIVLNNNSFATKKIILDYLKTKIASYKIPKKIIFVKEIPKTELGKNDIKQIQDLFDYAT